MLIREETINEYNLKKLQNKILEMMMDVDHLCNQNDIEYYMIDGSALGAKRHKGFIPWDDDMDIAMTPEHYKKFIRCFYSQMDQGKYHLQEWGSIDEMITLAKVRMNNTTYIESNLKNKQMHHGIYIDIVILHNCPNNRIQQIIQFLCAKYLVVLGLAHRGYAKRGMFSKIVLKTINILPNNFLRVFASKQIYKFQHSKTNYYCDFLSRARFKNSIYSKKIFGTPTAVEFETVKLKAPSNLHEYLIIRFDDYTKIPSPEKKIWGQHAEMWDTEKNYNCYLPDISSFTDEIGFY